MADEGRVASGTGTAGDAAVVGASGTGASQAAADSLASDAPITLNEYKKQQALVRTLIARRQEIEKRLASLEDTIANKEQAYLDATPNGNIITGYDHYMKSSGGAAAQRRKTGLGEQNKVFTRSSISYRPNASDSSATPGSTPAASHAPTPLSTTFKDGTGASNHATPTSAAPSVKGNKKRKLEEDSDDEAPTTGGNKKRTHFGAGRK